MRVGVTCRVGVRVGARVDVGVGVRAVVEAPGPDGPPRAAASTTPYRGLRSPG